MHLVHRQEGHGHPRRGLQEVPALQAELATELITDLRHSLFDLPLSPSLWDGVELTIGDDSGRDGPGILVRLGPGELLHFPIGKPVRHAGDSFSWQSHQKGSTV